MRGAYTEPVNKSLLLLPTMLCQLHTSSQHIIINCILNYSVQLTMMEWMWGVKKGCGELHSVSVFILNWSIMIMLLFLIVLLNFKILFALFNCICACKPVVPALTSYWPFWLSICSIFLKYFCYILTGDLFRFHLPLSACLMGNVLMQGYLTLEASHFPLRLRQINSLIKKKKKLE